MLKGSIEAKQQAEQDALRMSFILQKEKQEAERKRIEAQGIADFQRIVAQGISPQLLEWKGIEASEKLANGSNSKVILIGSPRNGLPIRITFEFEPLASFSLASIPFHSRSCGLIPCATMRWKSAIPCASIRLRSASCFSFCRMKV